MMAKCPRCGINELNETDVANSLSRRDNKTYICNKCGDQEAMVDYIVAELKKRGKETLAEFKLEIDSIWLKHGVPMFL